MKNLSRLFVLSLLLSGLVFASHARAEAMKNVIVMISDGCGDNTIRATDLYDGHAQAYESFPVRVHMCNYSWTTMNGYPGGPYAGYDSAQAWADFNYMLLRPTDSASAATAMSTGVKNRDNEINVDPIDRHRLFTVTERAKQLGKSAGVITTVEWSHATPAGFCAHNVNRNNYSQLAVEMLDTCNLDVIMGAGNPGFNDNGQPITPTDYSFVGGQAKWNQLVNGTTSHGWHLIQTRSEFQDLANGVNVQSPLCGTLQAHTTTQEARVPAEGANSPVAPYTVPLNANVPTLAEMSRGALNVLNLNPNGFFIMIEGGAIDWAGHADQHGRLVEEEKDFNAAVEAVIAWVEANSNWNETMLIVTADHETGYWWGPNSGAPATFNPLVDNGAGHLPGMYGYSGNHSNQVIPFFAKGEGSQYFTQFATRIDPVRGHYIDNTDVARVVFGYYDHILAVELRSFETHTVGGSIFLDWATASERQNDRFEIFRDGRMVASVASQGNSSTGHTYEWIDNDIELGNHYNYQLVAVDINGARSDLGSREASVRGTGSAEVSSYALYQNYPNPFNPSTQIAFDLPASGPVTLKVYNPMGQQVATLVSGNLATGHHTVSFDAGTLPSGIYFYKLSAIGFEAARKMLLVK